MAYTPDFTGIKNESWKTFSGKVNGAINGEIDHSEMCGLSGSRYPTIPKEVNSKIFIKPRLCFVYVINFHLSCEDMFNSVCRITCNSSGLFIVLNICTQFQLDRLRFVIIILYWFKNFLIS